MMVCFVPPIHQRVKCLCHCEGDSLTCIPLCNTYCKLFFSVKNFQYQVETKKQAGVECSCE
jgi:hypothetical protein